MNADKAYCAARDCRHYDDCERRMPDDVPDGNVWTIDWCNKMTKENEK